MKVTAWKYITVFSEVINKKILKSHCKTKKYTERIKGDFKILCEHR